MNRSLVMCTLLFLSASALISCRDTTERETVIREVEVERQEPKEDRKGILERSGERVDKEVNKKIDKEIEKIGDDN